MNSKQRMLMVNQNKETDRIAYAPTILEHSAKLINKTPSEVAVDADLLAEAQIKAYQVYEPDIVTVGIDIYNIEAEALGCKIQFFKENNISIPGVLTHPFNNFNCPKFTFSLDKGRISTILKASENIYRRIGNEVNISVGISGPFSIAMELVGYENFVVKRFEEDNQKRIQNIIENILEFQKRFCDEILKRNVGITIFESWAAPPLITTEIYNEYVKPYEKELIKYIKSKNVSSVPLVIGGNTTKIIDDIIGTGTTMIIADYCVNVSDYVQKAKNSNLILRGNIDPKLIKKGPIDKIIQNADKILDEIGGYKKFILGTGVIPYDTPEENILALKKHLEDV
jgi:uroporphyrinogen decarboxylase